jgi:hypothetical protein
MGKAALILVARLIFGGVFAMAAAFKFLISRSNAMRRRCSSLLAGCGSFSPMLDVLPHRRRIHLRKLRTELIIEA